MRWPVLPAFGEIEDRTAAPAKPDALCPLVDLFHLYRIGHRMYRNYPGFLSRLYLPDAPCPLADLFHLCRIGHRMYRNYPGFLSRPYLPVLLFYYSFF
jgi:hypothetical protein